MESYKYLIIGGGMTSDAAVRGIREHDLSGRIGIVSEEEFAPYDRPPLTKGLWFGKQEDVIWRKTELENVSLHLKCSIREIDPKKHLAIDQNGNEFSYEKLLLATGGTPKKLSGEDIDVIYYRTLNDYHRLRKFYDEKDEFIVIGSGYIGTEIAAALAMNGKKVTMIFQEPSIGSKRYPKNFSYFLNAYFTEKGVQLIPDQSVTSVKNENNKYRVKTSSGELFFADAVIAGLGISPNIQLAEKAQLQVDDGIVVNSFMQTSHPDIYAAGDVANFYIYPLKKHARIEHEDNANAMGRCAGENMADAGKEYTYLPYIYSDLFELGYEAIGELSSEMEIVEDWHDLYRKGILYYLQNGKVRGAVLWSIWDQLDTIRELIASDNVFSHEELIGKVTF